MHKHIVTHTGKQQHHYLTGKQHHQTMHKHIVTLQVNNIITIPITSTQHHYPRHKYIIPYR